MCVCVCLLIGLFIIVARCVAAICLSLDSGVRLLHIHHHYYH